MATGTKELIHYINEHVLECSICTEPFNNPKSLECLHVFCHDCIDIHIQKTLKHNHYKCPLCNENHVLPRDGIKSLRNAFLQKSLVEVANLIQKKTIVCSSCDEGNDAKSACSTCGDFLCADCTAIHKRMKLTKTHDLVPVSDLRDTQKLADFQKVRYNTCETHDGEACKLYCNADDTQICHICTYDPKHKGHDVISIDAKLQQLKMEVNKTEQSLHNKLQILKKQSKTVSNALSDIQKDEKQALDTITNRVNALEETIRQYKTKATEQVKLLATTQQKPLESVQKKLESDIKQYEKLAHKTKILDSLPVPTAIQVAHDVIKNGNSQPDVDAISKDDFEKDLAKIRFTVSTLKDDEIEPVLKSVIGFVPDTIGPYEPYEIKTKQTDMPESMQSLTISVIQATLWEKRHLERNSENCMEMARTCNEQLQDRENGKWNCYITPGEFGCWRYNKPGTRLKLKINDLHVSAYQIP